MMILRKAACVIFSTAALLFAGFDSTAVPPLPAPPANAVRVATADALIAAVGASTRGQTILLADGTYQLNSSLRIMTQGITLRGASDDPRKAILRGKGFGNSDSNEELVKIEAADITIACLTIRDVRSNGLKIQSGANHNLLVHNVHFIDICERSIKGPDVEVSRNGEVRYCYFEQVTPITSAIPDLYANGDYIAGMDMMKIDGWRIRDNLFMNIRGMNGGGRAAIFLWNNCRNCTVERNTIIDCDRGIAFGNASGSATRTHAINMLCRNNFIASDKSDAGIEIAGADSIRLYHNTVWKKDESTGRGIRFIADYANIELRNNLLRGRLIYDAGVSTGVTESGNMVGPLAGYFQDPASGNLHLTAAATGAIDHAAALSSVTDDWDGAPRPSTPDIGADEYGSATNLIRGRASPARPTVTAHFLARVLLNGREVQSGDPKVGGLMIGRTGLTDCSRIVMLRKGRK